MGARTPAPTVTTSSAAVKTGPRLQGAPWATLLIVSLGVMMADLDMTIVAIANPVIKEDLGASLADVQWVTNGYLLALAGFLIPAGRLGDRFGHRQTFLVGVAGFTLCSTAIGLSGHIGLVIALRVLQGLFGALLTPAALGVLRTTFSAERLPVALGVYGMVIGVSTAAGPLVGGLLVEHVNWQAVFFINSPIGLCVVAAGIPLLARHTSDKVTRSFDLPGVVLLCSAMFCLVHPLIRADRLRKGDTGTWLVLAAAAVLFVLFVIRERKAREPVLPLRLFRSRSLAAGTALAVVMAFALIGGLFFITFYLQNVHGLGPAESGLRLLPLTAVMIVASPLAGQLIARLGPRFPMLVGMLITSTALLGLGRLTTASTTLTTSGWFALLGLGLAPIVVGSTGVIVGNAPEELSGVAGGIQQSALQIGGSLGTAVLGALVASHTSGKLPDRWASAGLPRLSESQLQQASDAVSVGQSPVPTGTPLPLAEKITGLTQDIFLSGMRLAFTTGAVIALLGALLALLITRTSDDTAAGDH
jgi:EmrB/QacA subfamily drug resistance transporter